MKIENETFWDRIYFIFALLFPVSTLAIYSQLPLKIGIHIKNGQFDQMVDKPLYLAIYPIIMGGYYYYSKIKRADGPANRLLLIVILLAAHVMILYYNLFKNL